MTASEAASCDDGIRFCKTVKNKKTPWVIQKCATDKQCQFRDDGYSERLQFQRDEELILADDVDPHNYNYESKFQPQTEFDSKFGDITDDELVPETVTRKTTKRRPFLRSSFRSLLIHNDDNLPEKETEDLSQDCCDEDFCNCVGDQCVNGEIPDEVEDILSDCADPHCASIGEDDYDDYDNYDYEEPDQFYTRLLTTLSTTAKSKISTVKASNSATFHHLPFVTFIISIVFSLALCLF